MRIDEFAFILLAGLVMIIVMMVAWSTMPAAQLDVSPLSVSLSIQIGSSRSFPLNLNGTATNVSLYATGAIKGWVSFDKNNFDVSGSEVVNVFISVPSTAVEKVYTGSIEITYSEGKKSIPVSINTSKIPVVEVSYPIYFGDFSVSYEVGTKTLASKEDFEVSRGYFSDYPVNLVHESLTEDMLSKVTGGFIRVVVDETNNAGNLIVSFNGQEVYNQNTAPGEVSIELEESQIKKSNTVTISAGLPGWKFWMSTVYKISTAKFGISYFGVTEREDSFELDSSMIRNFKYGVLTFRVKESTPGKDLIIKINEDVLFKGEWTAKSFTRSFTSEIRLREGTNKISFSTEPNSFYELADVTLTIIYLA